MGVQLWFAQRKLTLGTSIDVKGSMKTLFATVLVVFLYGAVASAQKNPIDSLEAELKPYISTGRFTPRALDAMLDLAWRYRSKSMKTAVDYANRVLDYARKKKLAEIEIKAYLKRGSIYGASGVLDKAAPDFDAAYRLAAEKKFPTLTAAALNGQALLLDRQGRYREALAKHKEAISIRIKEGDEAGLIASYTNIGVVERKMGNPDRALEYYLNAAELLEKQQDNISLANVYNNMGNVLRELKQYSQSVEKLKMALAVYEKYGTQQDIAMAHMNIGSTLMFAEDTAQGNIHFLKAARIQRSRDDIVSNVYANINLGVYYSNLHQTDSAVYYFTKALNLAESIPDPERIIICLNELARLSIEENDHSKAQAYLQRAFGLAKSSSARMQLAETLSMQTQAYASQGDYKSAFRVYQQYTALRDSLYTIDRADKMAALEVQYNLQLSENEKALLQKQQALQLAELQNNRSQLRLLEQDKKLKGLLLRSQETKLAFHEEHDRRNKKEIEALTQAQRVRSMQLERQRWLSGIWFAGVIVLAIVTVLLIVLYRNRKRSEHIHKQKNRELQQATGEIVKQKFELQEKSAALAAVLEEVRLKNSQLEELNVEKSELLAIAAHDLKNPIGVILGFADLLKHPDVSPELKSESVDHIYDTSKRMLRLVSDLLDVEKLDAGPQVFRRMPVDIAAILQDAVRDNGNHAAEKSIELQLSYEQVNHLALGDVAIIAQIADNLLSNAIKFSNAGSTVIINAFSEPSRVIFEIQDQGPGFSDEDKKRMFAKFARLSAQPTGGELSTGLGLYIVKRYIEGMNGSIACMSEQGKGATFRIQLPTAGVVNKVKVVEEDIGY